jgi:hypothetical protein
MPQLSNYNIVNIKTKEKRPQMRPFNLLEISL